MQAIDESMLTTQSDASDNNQQQASAPTGFMARMMSTKAAVAASIQAKAATISATSQSYIHAAQEKIQTLQKRRSETADGADVVQAEEQIHAGSGGDAETSNAGSQFASTLLTAATDLGKKTRESGSAAYHAAVEQLTAGVQGLKTRLAPRRRVALVVRNEAKARPCPHVILVCCTVVVTRGLSTYGILKSTPPNNVVESLAAQLEDTLGLVPSDVDPATAAAVIKHFLSSLDEPLLVREMADEWIAAGFDLDRVPQVLSSLPLANLCTLHVLMETCYRVASQFNLTGMNALSLATELCGCLLWRQAPGARLAGAPNTKVPSVVPTINAHIQSLRARLAHGSAGQGSSSAEAQEQAEAALMAKASQPATAEEEEEAAHQGAGEEGGQEGGEVVGKDGGEERAKQGDKESDVESDKEGVPAVVPTSTQAADVDKATEEEEEEGLEHEEIEGREVGGEEAEAEAAEAEADASAPGGPRLPLAGAEKESVVRALEYIILNFEELFATP